MHNKTARNDRRIKCTHIHQAITSQTRRAAHHAHRDRSTRTNGQARRIAAAPARLRAYLGAHERRSAGSTAGRAAWRALGSPSGTPNFGINCCFRPPQLLATSEPITAAALGLHRALVARDRRCAIVCCPGGKPSVAAPETMWDPTCDAHVPALVNSLPQECSGVKPSSYEKARLSTLRWPIDARRRQSK